LSVSFKKLRSGIREKNGELQDEFLDSRKTIEESIIELLFGSPQLFKKSDESITMEEMF
jgi:hypothetical protein